MAGVMLAGEILILNAPSVFSAKAIYYLGSLGRTGTAFSSTHLASMFVNSINNAFPFNTTTAIGLDLLNDLVSTYGSTRSIVINNAAQYGGSPPQAELDPSILCYQNIGTGCPTVSSNIAFQEVGPRLRRSPVVI